jgi:hypothetical protein
MKNAAILIFLILLGAVTFELLPGIERARIVVPEEIYVDKDCGCDCVLQSRPWYSRFNYWLWISVLAVPIFVFSVKPSAPKWQRAVRSLIAIAFCYGAINMAVHLMWDIRNGPFWVVDGYPWQKSWDDLGTKCANFGDGASIVFALMFGWLYATIYTGWWEMIWFQYHRRKTKLIGDEFKRDWFNKIVVGISVTIPALIILIVFVTTILHFAPEYLPN